jgi:uncharacterized phiE125 gp8 family phage protein
VHKTELINAPATELLTVDEAKSHLNYSSNSKDDEIERMIKAFRQAIERYLKRALITQEWKVYYDCWHDELKIPFGNLKIVEAVEAIEADPDADPPVEAVAAVNGSVVINYYDVYGQLQPLDEDIFFWVDNKIDPAKIVRKYEAIYPQLQYGRPNAIEISFTCGYGDSASDVPEDIIHALKVMLTDYFEHKGSIVVEKGVAKIPDHITGLLHDYKLYTF